MKPSSKLKKLREDVMRFLEPSKSIKMAKKLSRLREAKITSE